MQQRIQEIVAPYGVTVAGIEPIKVGYLSENYKEWLLVSVQEHHDIWWYSIDEVRDPQFNIKPAVCAYAIEFLEKYGSGNPLTG